jgi:hypothetical protein
LGQGPGALPGPSTGLGVNPQPLFFLLNEERKDASRLQPGWRMVTHAIGDRAVRPLLDVYQRRIRDNLQPGP